MAVVIWPDLIEKIAKATRLDLRHTIPLSMQKKHLSHKSSKNSNCVNLYGSICYLFKNNFRLKTL